MTPTDTIGLIAASFTTLSFLPQAIKVIKTKDTAALSLMMYSIFTLGVAFWLCYGLLIKNKAIIIANLITLCLAVCILGVKIHNDFLKK